MTLSKPNYFPKALSPNTITLRLTASTYEFGGGGGHNSAHNRKTKIKKVVREDWNTLLKDVTFDA